MKCYPVPPVPTAQWTEVDWEKAAYECEEPNTIEALGFRWIAMGEYNLRGQMLYRIDCREDK